MNDESSGEWHTSTCTHLQWCLFWLASCFDNRHYRANLSIHMLGAQYTRFVGHGQSSLLSSPQKRLFRSADQGLATSVINFVHKKR